MTKRQLIDEIMTVNRSADPEFLAEFDSPDLTEYLDHLRVLGVPRLSGDPHRYDKYFENLPPGRPRVGADVGDPARQVRELTPVGVPDTGSPSAENDNDPETWLF